jgi:L-rhamnose mutarotase
VDAMLIPKGEGGSVRRFGMIIRLKPDKVEEYKELHRNVWPEVLKTIKDCHIQNYTIFYKDGYLFSYYEYTGENYEEDMKKMAETPSHRSGGLSVNPARNL